MNTSQQEAQQVSKSRIGQLLNSTMRLLNSPAGQVVTRIIVTTCVTVIEHHIGQC